jgi:hypothetical protein
VTLPDHPGVQILGFGEVFLQPQLADLTTAYRNIVG